MDKRLPEKLTELMFRLEAIEEKLEGNPVEYDLFKVRLEIYLIVEELEKIKE